MRVPNGRRRFRSLSLWTRDTRNQDFLCEMVVSPDVRDIEQIEIAGWNAQRIPLLFNLRVVVANKCSQIGNRIDVFSGHPIVISDPQCLKFFTWSQMTAQSPSHAWVTRKHQGDGSPRFNDAAPFPQNLMRLGEVLQYVCGNETVETGVRKAELGCVFALNRDGPLAPRRRGGVSDLVEHGGIEVGNDIFVKGVTRVGDMDSCSGPDFQHARKMLVWSEGLFTPDMALGEEPGRQALAIVGGLVGCCPTLHVIVKAWIWLHSRGKLSNRGKHSHSARSVQRVDRRPTPSFWPLGEQMSLGHDGVQNLGKVRESYLFMQGFMQS